MHFRKKNEGVDELVEAFTKIIPLKARINMNLNSAHNFLIYADSARIEYELR